MIADHYRDKWQQSQSGLLPYQPSSPYVQINWPDKPQVGPLAPFKTHPTQNVEKDIDDLRKEVQEMKELLKRAIKYDEDNKEPHCETKEKIEWIRKVAEAVGLTLDDVFGEHQ
jgi:hypothetical protein